MIFGTSYMTEGGVLHFPLARTVILATDVEGNIAEYEAVLSFVPSTQTYYTVEQSLWDTIFPQVTVQ